MRTQEQTFRAYYASMTDAELLQIAANRKSFIKVAQAVLASELEKRGLTPASTPPPPVHHSFLWSWLHHHPAST
ncbi:MAG TPA: hypothetical protein VGF16_10900 [Bryobacteraceae bacterium]|jgi:hypothetical protein